jgi:hypothetical protein
MEKITWGLTKESPPPFVCVGSRFEEDWELEEKFFIITFETQHIVNSQKISYRNIRQCSNRFVSGNLKLKSDIKGNQR